MKNHKCIDENKEIGCICDISAMEPDEQCPVHGYGIFPPKCYICGKFIPLNESIHKSNFEIKGKVKNDKK